jgi:hypothetical protein
MGAPAGIYLVTTVLWIDESFPDAQGGYRKTSEPDDLYNCIGWALGSRTEWWSHLPGYLWADIRSPDADSLQSVFEQAGFERCADGVLEAGHTKVALYASNGRWTHAARLDANGWTSKLGVDEDISHDSAETLTGATYGTVVCFMRRPDA